MATKKFKYGHLYSLTSGATPTVGQMIPGEIALNLNSGFTRMWASDGTNLIDLSGKLGGSGDELSIHTEVVGDNKVMSSLVYLKDITAEFDGSTPAKTLPANVLKRYALVDAAGNNVVTSANTVNVSGNTSEYVDIPKDASLIEVYLGTKWDYVVSVSAATIHKYAIGDIIPDGPDAGHEVIAEDVKYLNFEYLDSNGEYTLTKIDLRQFLIEYQFASGVTFDAVANKVRGVVDYTSGNVVTEWSDGNYDAEGAITVTESGLTVDADGFKLQNIQKAIDAKHANTIKMNGYSSSAGTEEIFDIVTGDTVAKAIMKIENKLTSNGTGVAAGGGAEVNNTGIVFIEGGEDIVLLGAGQF